MNSNEKVILLLLKPTLKKYNLICRISGEDCPRALRLKGLIEDISQLYFNEGQNKDI